MNSPICWHMFVYSVCCFSADFCPNKMPRGPCCWIYDLISPDYHLFNHLCSVFSTSGCQTDHWLLDIFGDFEHFQKVDFALMKFKSEMSEVRAKLSPISPSRMSPDTIREQRCCTHIQDRCHKSHCDVFMHFCNPLLW